MTEEREKVEAVPVATAPVRSITLTDNGKGRWVVDHQNAPDWRHQVKMLAASIRDTEVRNSLGL